MSDGWIKQTLIAQAAEIAAAGHAGWGNTMLEAADALEAQAAEIERLDDLLQRQAVETLEANLQIEALRALATCGCGDGFTAHDQGTCVNCLAAIEAGKAVTP